DLARKIRHLFANRDHRLALAAAPAPAAPVAASPAALSILVVEDNTDMREMTTEVLAALGYQVASAGSGEEALALLAQRSVDVLLTDVGLPGMSGYQLAERARAHGIGAVLFASGYGASSDLPPGTFWLQKPFSLDNIEAALARIAAWAAAN
ncbi:MAG: response regulator, partial [Telluria sp.]